MTQTIGIGVIGMGWMGTVHSRSYRQITDRFQIAASDRVWSFALTKSKPVLDN